MAVHCAAGLVCSASNGTGKSIPVGKRIRVVVRAASQDVSESRYIHPVDFKTDIDSIIGHYPV